MTGRGCLGFVNTNQEPNPRELQSRKFGVCRQSKATMALWIHLALALCRIQSGVALRLPPHSKLVSQNSKSRHFLLTICDRLRRDFSEENSLRPEHLFASVHKLQFVQAGLLAWHRLTSSAFTVARPRGILTRFPILPAFMRGTRTHLKELRNVSSLKWRQLTMRSCSCQSHLRSLT